MYAPYDAYCCMHMLVHMYTQDTALSVALWTTALSTFKRCLAGTVSAGRWIYVGILKLIGIMVGVSHGL